MPLVKDAVHTIADIRALPEGERAELIDGTLYMLSAPGTRHQRLVRKAMTAIDQYISRHGGPCEVFSSPFAVFLSNDEDYVEPDVSVICRPEIMDERGCHGASDWIIEIVSPSSRSMDYMIKLVKYQSEGVREYWVVDPDKDRVLVYSFEKGEVTDYAIRDSVPAGIYDHDLTICFSDG